MLRMMTLFCFHMNNPIPLNPESYCQHLFQPQSELANCNLPGAWKTDDGFVGANSNLLGTSDDALDHDYQGSRIVVLRIICYSAELGGC